MYPCELRIKASGEWKGFNGYILFTFYRPVNSLQILMPCYEVQFLFFSKNNEIHL